MRKRLALFLFASSLGACSFVYPKAITFNEAKNILSSSISSFNEKKGEAKTFGIGLKKKERKTTKEETKEEIEETFFVRYHLLGESSFSFDYFDDMTSSETTFVTVTKDGGSIEVNDVYTDEKRQYDAENDKDLQPFFDFSSNYYPKLAESFLKTASTLMSAIGDEEKTNELTLYTALSSASDQLSLYFQGKDIGLPDLLFFEISEGAKCDSLDVTIENGLLSKVAVEYAYSESEDTSVKGTFTLDFEMK